MRPIATDGAAWSVCMLVSFVSPAKTAELTEMRLGGRTSVSPVNFVLDRGQNRTNLFAVERVAR